MLKRKMRDKKYHIGFDDMKASCDLSQRNLGEGL